MTLWKNPRSFYAALAWLKLAALADLWPSSGLPVALQSSDMTLLGSFLPSPLSLTQERPNYGEGLLTPARQSSRGGAKGKCRSISKRIHTSAFSGMTCLLGFPLLDQPPVSVLCPSSLLVVPVIRAHLARPFFAAGRGDKIALSRKADKGGENEGEPKSLLPLVCGGCCTGSGGIRDSCAFHPTFPSLDSLL